MVLNMQGAKGGEAQDVERRSIEQRQKLEMSNKNAGEGY